jgi:RNA polymerase sigma-32 factor
LSPFLPVLVVIFASEHIMQSIAKKSLPVIHDALQSYVQQVRQIPLLSPEEEHALAVKCRQQEDIEAAQRLVIGNLRLVIKIALTFYHRFSSSLMDLIQEGNLGLMQAVKNFDPFRGVRLSSYAAYWIKAYILRFLMAYLRLVKIGTTQTQRKLLYHLHKEKEHMEKMGLCTCQTCLPAALGIEQDTVVEMEQRLAEPEQSLDMPAGDNSRETLKDHVTSNKTLFDEELACRELRQLLSERLKQLEPRLTKKERDILKARLLSEKPDTLQKMGSAYGVSKERMRQIEMRLKNKIKDYLQIDLDDVRPCL